MNTDIQTKTILQHLCKHKSITSIQAFELYGITRLSARIFDLRSAGHKIGLIWETSLNRFGIPTRYGKYFLIQKKKD